MPDDGNKGSFVQGYNVQIAVDAASQVIVAAEITQETNDKMQLIPMIAQMVTNLERKPEKVSADAGYFSEANVTDESVTACSALWAKCVRPSFIFATRASSSTGLFHTLFEVRFLRLRSSRARSSRVGVSMPDALARPVRNSS